MEAKTAETKKIAFSAIQPTSIPTLGNYLGALKHWAELQDDYNAIYCIADAHALTVRQNPTELRKRTLEAYAMIMACGIDPEKSPFFIQSHVPAHAQAAWVLDCYTQFGELSRMTQFKDKSAKHADNINAGLFTYPSLMAADILLYQTDVVPVGEDQKQHVEIARDIAQRFNTINGEVFTIPEPIIQKVGARIMSLQDPTRKMSKSDENPNGSIFLTDTDDQIMKKFKRAVTDSDACVKFGDGKGGVSNLMSILSVITGKTIAEIETEFEGKGYGEFKIAVGEAVVSEIAPVREKFNQLMSDKAYLEECYRKGAEQASRMANKTLRKMYKKIGLLSL